MGEWETIPLGDLVEPGRSISYGIVQPGTHITDGIPIVRAGDVRDGSVDTSAPFRVSPNVESPFGRTRLRGGELLITLVGSVGNTAIALPNLAGWNVARAVGVVPVDPRNSANWVRYALKHHAVAARIEQRLNTTVQATLNLGELSALPIPMPPEPERTAAESALAAIDDKIEVNRRMAATLEEMARALFKSWFVDFDPVRAKAEGREPGVPSKIADLFPDRLADSPLGPIPDGWTVQPLSALASLVNRPIDPGRQPDTAWHHFSIPAFDEGRLPRHDLGSSIKSGKYVVPSDSVLISKLNPSTPRVWMPHVAEPSSSICSTEFLPFRPHVTTDRSFLFELLRSEPFTTAVQSRVTGSTGSRQRVLPGTVASIPALDPGPSLRLAYASAVMAWHAAVAEHVRQSALLDELRDSLLPKLVSGAIRIADPENFLARMEAVG